MTRVKTFDSTGLATAGRLYAGDLNLIQDQYADLVNYSQTHGVALLAVGDATLQLLKYGPGEMRLTGHVRTDGVLRALGGLFGGTFTTPARDAIPAGSRPYGLLIINSQTNRPEWNAGTDAVPNWQPIGITTIPPDSITATELANGSVGQNELAANAVIASKVDGSLKPSVSAAAATEALRALGTTGAMAAAGNDARLSDARTPTDGSVTLAKIAASLKPSGSAAAGDEALRAIGAGAGQVIAGNDARLSDARAPIAHAASHARGGSDAVLVNNSIDAGHIGPGAGGADDFGTSFPGTGLFNGYRFTIFLNNLAYDCVYRSDIDASYPWHVMGGPNLVVTTTDLNYVTAAWATFLQLTVPKTGLWKVHVGTHAITVQGQTEVNRVLAGGGEQIRNSVFNFGNGHVLIDWESTLAMSTGQLIEVQHQSNGTDGQHTIANITLYPLRLQ